jgi:hypothetical protein
MTPVHIAFWLPPAEAEGLKRVHPRDNSEAAKRIVRAALYRERRRQERLTFKKKQREARNAGV